jgi:sugar lactone lactonase YvrE
MTRPRPIARVRIAALCVLALGSLVWAVSPATAAHPTGRIDLPDGFQPEGIHVSPDGTFYTGSLVDGTILVGDVKTGQMQTLVTPPAGRISVGMEVSHGLLYVAGGPTGAFVYDATTGATVRAYGVGASGFVNDVVVTGDAAWFTDSFAALLHRVPLSGNGMPGTVVETIPLTGDFTLRDGFNLNGIEAARGGRVLIAIQSNTGDLFRVDPGTGETARIDLGDHSLLAGDGLLLRGRTLYVGRNTNVVDVVRIEGRLTSGRIVDEITSPDFDVPTTLGRAGNRLYVVQARFGVAPEPDTPYWIAVVPAH